VRFSVRGIDLFLRDGRTRLPFRFGVVTMTAAPTCVARARIETDAGEFFGYSSDLLVPKWFDKDPDKSLEQDARDLVASARLAADAFMAGVSTDTLFAQWWRVYGERQSPDPEARDRLVRGFGVALCERALMDAVCRAAGLSFHAALRADLFGFRPSEALPELGGWDLARSLPAEPQSSVDVRHTIGLADALRAADAEDDPADGLPIALEEDIRRYGFTHFKIKLNGDREHDLARLMEIAAVFVAEGVTAPRVTVDGNEQFEDLGQLVSLFEEAARSTPVQSLLAGLLYIEQPLARAHSFDPDRTAAMGALEKWGPVVIDEADTGLDSFPRALALGYGGVSVKNCKGVFRALLTRGLCERHGSAFQCSEDLTNLPVLALQQDLATLASLGLTHTERNGHHYFRGLELLPEDERAGALRAHPDLYSSGEHGTDLRIAGGRLEFASIHGPGYGHSTDVNVEARIPSAEWEART